MDVGLWTWDKEDGGWTCGRKNGRWCVGDVRVLVNAKWVQSPRMVICASSLSWAAGPLLPLRVVCGHVDRRAQAIERRCAVSPSRSQQVDQVARVGQCRVGGWW